MEDALYDSQALRGFAGITLNRDPVPDATTVLHFRHWLERHDLTKGLFDEVGAMLEERGLLMRQGTIVDATHCRPVFDEEPAAEPRPGDAPDEEGQSVVFRHEGPHRGGCHLGAGAHGHGHRCQRSRHHPDGDAAARTGGRRVGDAGYTGADKRPELEDRDISWNIAIKRSIIKALPKTLRDLAEPVERALSQVRAVVEHPFHIVKNRFLKKLRYRGLHKNTAQLALFALANLVIAKKALLPPSSA